LNRRKFLQFLGAGAAVTAAGLMVPDVARKIFLPPRAGWTLGAEPGLNVGDVLTFEGVYDPLVIRKCKQFIVVSVSDHDHYIERYDATWTLPSGEEQQHSIEFDDGPGDDSIARRILESKMRALNATPGSKHFKLNLSPNPIFNARYI
jgi:hypothetical protein